MYDLEMIKCLLSRCTWRWAKTYVNIPHEYIVRGKCVLTDEEFLYIVHAQRELGIHQKWGKYNFPYLYIDGYKYWTMGDTFENTIILNRQKLFDEFDMLDNPDATYYEEHVFHKIAETIRSYDKSIFEIGCGDGRLTQEIFITPERYFGVEPSKKLFTLFKDRNVEFQHRIINKPFEECTDKWRDIDCILVALFGSASYIMRPYLEMIVRFNKPHFLMFYEAGKCPYIFKEMHHFDWTKEDLSALFINSIIYNEEGYYIVQSSS